LNTYRIGVIADTHDPEFMPTLPAEIAAIFRGVDLIVHLGDVTGQDVLRDLSTIAPVVAVRGEHDRLPLPAKTVIQVGGLRLGLIHGKQPIHHALAAHAGNMARPQRSLWWNGFLHDAVSAFRDVDAILFAHAHRPHMAWRDGVLLFSPGAVYSRTPELTRAELARKPSLLRRLYLERWLRQAQRQGRDAEVLPTVGILTISDGKIHAEVRSITPASERTD
jgi:putative phosphoesterase